MDILPGLKSGASTSLTSLRPLGIEPNGRRSRCIPPLEKEGFSEQAPWIKSTLTIQCTHTSQGWLVNDQGPVKVLPNQTAYNVEI